MHLNPALQLFMIATLRGVALNWPTGADQLMLCSVGTGSYMNTASREQVLKSNNIQLLMMLISQVLRDSSELNQTLLQWISTSPTAHTIDSQIGTLQHDLLSQQPLLTYLRYNIELDDADLRKLGMTLSPDELKRVRQMSNINSMDLLETIGSAAADRQVHADHFDTAFDGA